MPKTKEKKKEGHLAPGSVRRIRGISACLDDLTLHGGRFTEKVGEPMSADVTRSIEGASTITIQMFDPDGDLLRSKLLKRRVDVKLDGLWSRLVQLGVDPPILTMVFEERPTAFMRLVTEPVKVYRDQVTRAEFVYSLVRMVRGHKIPVYIPELHKVQPIETTQQASATSTSTATADTQGSSSAQGLDTSANLTVKGVAATPEQMRNAETIIGVGVSLDAPEDAIVACLMAATQENGMTNTNHGSACMNIFCVTTAALGVVESAGTTVSDVAGNAKIMYTTGFWHAGLIESVNNGLSPGAAAQAAEGSAYPSAYDPWEAEGRKWVAAYTGGGISASVSGASSGGGQTKTKTKRYAFELKNGEDAWDCTMRLAEEVNFRRYVSSGVFYYVSEEKLFEAKPLMYLNWDNDGLDPVTFDWDKGKKVNEGSIAGHLRAYAAPPGTVVKLTDDYGPGAGRYLVTEITSSLFNDQFTASIKTPMQELPEPAAETETISTGGSTGESGDFAANEESSSEAGVGSFDGKQVAKWIIPWLEKSRAEGWSGSVTSGYRTPEYSESLCFGMCGAPSCPGTCAGRSSNHSGDHYPAGAVDVSDYSNFGSIQPRIGSPLKNNLPADRVHFSVSGQ